MKISIVAPSLAVAGVLLAASFTSPAFARTPADDEAEVLASAAAIVAAFGRHDPGAYFALFDPKASFIFHNSPRRLENREEYRREWAAWEKDLGFRVKGCRSTDRRVQLFGDTAIFTHTVQSDIATRDGVSTLNERETIVFLRRNGKWVAIHEHLSPLPGPAAT